MKIDDYELPLGKQILQFYKEHSDEVFTIKETKQRLELSDSRQKIKYWLEKDSNIYRLDLSSQEVVYGCEEAINKIKNRFVDIYD